jgi:4-diphosphocytidyl-2-C-methyl-D-erythritol kinase
MATRVRSYSKINLGLAIGPVRADGFHGLATLYQTLALHDFVTVEARLIEGEFREGRGGQSQDGTSTNAGVLRSAQNDKRGGGPHSSEAVEPMSQSRDMGHPDSGGTRITLTTNDGRVPVDGRNTAWRMVELALSRMGVAAEVAIHIEKELPVQGGMGAGSANAAAALIGLERELGVALPEAERLELAAAVGSDVPLFLVGGAVLGMGRGEVVSAMADLPATWCVVAVPEVGVSTPRAFRDWDELQTKVLAIGSASLLTSVAQPDKLKELSHAYASILGLPNDLENLTEQAPDTSGIVRGLNAVQAAEDKTLNGLAGNTLLALVRTGIENDFEQVVFPQYPLLREIKRLLMGTSAGVSSDGPADLSGGAVYAALSGSGSALFGLYSSEMDARAAQRRVRASGCKAILTETLPRQEYWRRMFAE